MKKTLCMILIAAFCLLMISCGDNGNGNITPPATNIPDTTKVPDITLIPDITNVPDTTGDNEIPEATTSPTETAPLATDNDTSSPADIDRRMIF